MANAPIPNLDKCLIGPTPYEERDPWAKAGILSDVLEGEMGLKVHRGGNSQPMPVRRRVQMLEETLRTGRPHPGLNLVPAVDDPEITRD
ncbi:MAG: hypothetical protein E6Q65_09575 [Ottowia sp.]|nr:MAG: hypothetical protein E6Q65_09575 [Ottowia sp.]